MAVNRLLCRAVLVAMVVLALRVDAHTDEATGFVLRGRVVDARTGEPIAKALVSIRERRLEALTDASGAFELRGVPAGPAELYVSTVGYGLVKRAVNVSGPTEVSVLLGQEAIKRSEEVSVTTSVFEPYEPGAPSEHTLDSLELRNLASVIADDPLRSIQALPGVVTGDDFNATFSVRGSGFDSVGLYIDGVLASSPFHTIRDVNDGYSLMIVNGDVVEAVSLVSSAPSARYGDRVGAALNVETRDGGREKRFTRAHLGAAGVSFWNEGPLGKAKNTSWLVGGRKSFLDYVIDRIEGGDPSLVVGYYDLQAKLSHAASAHRLSLFLLHGDALWREDDPGQGRNSLARADATTQLASARWRYAPRAGTALVWNAYLTRESGRNRNRDDATLYRAESLQTGLRGDLTQAIGSRHTLDAGLLLRRLQEDAAEQRFLGQSAAPRTLYAYDRPSWQPGLYAQDTWRLFGGRLKLTLGGRFDRWGTTGESAFLPRASATLTLSARSKLGAALGGYAQFPALSRLYGDRANADLQAERSSHYVLNYERLVSDRLRVRVELYDQEESRRLFLPNSEYRSEAGRIVLPSPRAVFTNSLAGRSRGFELFVQRRSANGLSGWISYAHGRTRLRDAVTGLSFDSDFDQRHTLNAYASCRVNDRLNLSAKYRYGSGIPIPGFYGLAGGDTVLAQRRNLLHGPAYSRLDLRANRAFFFKRSKLTLYAEISNALNRTHYRYSDASVDLRTGRVFFERDTLFPFLPAVGVTLEF